MTTDTDIKKPRKKTERLLHVNLLRLSEWLKVPANFESIDTIEGLSKAAAVHLGCHVPTSSVNSAIAALKELGIEVALKKRPSSGKDRTQVLAMQLKKVSEHCNIPMSEEFLAICGKKSIVGHAIGAAGPVT